MRTTMFLFLAASLAVACGKKDSGKGEGGGGSSGPAVGTPAAEVNALVPKDKAGALTFEYAAGEKNQTVAPAPKGWKTGFMPGSYEPPENSNFGFSTRFSVSSNCDGDCAAKDWAATTDKVEFAQLTSGSMKVEKDEKGDGSRFVVATGDDGAVVVGAWWKKDSSRYFYCRAKLDKEALPFLAAFEKACRMVHISSWD